MFLQQKALVFFPRKIANCNSVPYETQPQFWTVSCGARGDGVLDVFGFQNDFARSAIAIAQQPHEKQSPYLL